MEATFSSCTTDPGFLLSCQDWLLLVLFPLLKVLLIFAIVVLAITPLLTLAERKISAWMQDRVGPNRAHIFKVGGKPFTAGGLFHTMADAVKMFVKEFTIPAAADKLLFLLAPIIGLIPALVAFAVIPFGPAFDINIHDGQGGVKPYSIGLQISNLNVGVLFLFAISSLGVYGAALAGWASNNKVALLGSLRASAQSISYEITFGLTLVGLMMVFQTVQLNQMVIGQTDLAWGWLPKWGIFMQPLGFVLFFAAALAENKRIPFDLPEGESEIVGYFVEYSSFGFGLFMTTEFIEMVVIAFLTTSLFFGGWDPIIVREGVLLGMWKLPTVLWVLIGFLAFMTKVIALLFMQFVVRWALPRFRYDQLMHLGWRIMLPLSLANIGITGLAVLLGGDNAVMAIGLAIIAVFIVSLSFKRKPNEAPVHHAPAGAHH